MKTTKHTGPGIFVLSSPSGGGKTTLVKFMKKKFPDIIYSVSTTSRKPRPGDKNGRDYNFITPAAFRKGIKENKFVEWATVHGNYYGTPELNIKNALKKGRSVLLDLDVKGAMQVKKLFPEAVLIFITAPGIQELRRRIISRGQDDMETIRRRLKNAREELRKIKCFDFLIMNEDIRDAQKYMAAIYKAELCRIKNGGRI
ncbi:MAG: guanylate kinase [Elusimicrobia bacterium HGW-Elusimicrobia-2]|nr:MAG: guanylate kinase [Elusimicrobia bacterium HGW-Elusimicrobia-2]